MYSTGILFEYYVMYVCTCRREKEIKRELGLRGNLSGGDGGGFDEHKTAQKK